jgi:hypothetical protein
MCKTQLFFVFFVSVLNQCIGELTWSVTNAPTVYRWTAISSDSSGQNLVAFESTYVYTSDDFGSNLSLLVIGYLQLFFIRKYLE